MEKHVWLGQLLAVNEYLASIVDRDHFPREGDNPLHQHPRWIRWMGEGYYRSPRGYPPVTRRIILVGGSVCPLSNPRDSDAARQQHLPSVQGGLHTGAVDIAASRD